MFLIDYIADVQLSMASRQPPPEHTLVVAQHEHGLDVVGESGARVVICMSPNIDVDLRSEKTRSAAAELGVKEPTICIASAHVGMSSLLFL